MNTSRIAEEIRNHFNHNDEVMNNMNDYDLLEMTDGTFIRYAAEVRVAVADLCATIKQ